MPGFAESYLGQLRAVVGSRMLLVPGARVVLENQRGEILLQQRSDYETVNLSSSAYSKLEIIDTCPPSSRHPSEGWDPA